MTTETGSENGSKPWKKFFRKHWGIIVLFAVVAVSAAIGAVLVFLWFVGNAQSTGLVPTTLGLWAMSHLVAFILYTILWEVLIIGIPMIVAAVAGWLWWRRLPAEEKMEYHFFGTRSRTTSGGGGISLLILIAFAIKVYIDGNWNVPFATWTFDYLVYSLLWTVIWLLIIFAIPAAIGIIWWINHEMKKKP
jgi:hypothetical protein